MNHNNIIRVVILSQKTESGCRRLSSTMKFPTTVHDKRILYFHQDSHWPAAHKLSAKHSPRDDLFYDHWWGYLKTQKIHMAVRRTSQPFAWASTWAVLPGEIQAWARAWEWPRGGVQKSFRPQHWCDITFITMKHLVERWPKRKLDIKFNQWWFVWYQSWLSCIMQYQLYFNWFVYLS